MGARRAGARVRQNFGRHLLETTQTDMTHLAQLHETVDLGCAGATQAANWPLVWHSFRINCGQIN